MIYPKETLNKLLTLANTALMTHALPEQFARDAAHEAAHYAASKYSTEAADAATLLAANTLLLETSEAVSFSAHIADAATSKIGTEIAYVTLMKHRETMLHQTTRRVTNQYQTHFSCHPTEHHKAKHAAHYAYRHTYCVARSAYVIALHQANQLSEPNQRQRLFNKIILERLQHDLQYDVIKPNFFIQMMCSITIQVIAGLLVLGGVVVMGCGIALVLGGVAAVSGTGLLVGSFFAYKEKKQQDERNASCDQTTLNC
jgi:hypothetical protein